MNWKAYEEVHFSANNIQRWVREGDEYVNRMTLEQMGKFETKVRQQADLISVLEANYKIQVNIVEKQQDYIDQLEQGLRASIELNKAQAERQTKPLSDEEIEGIANANVDGYSSMEQLKWFARAILRKARD